MRAADFVTAIKAGAQRAASFLRPPRDQALTLQLLMRDSDAFDVFQQFHRLWYASEAGSSVRWMGQPVLKNPLDLWIYQQILLDQRPNVLIETGTHVGGSALYFSSIGSGGRLELDVVTIDFNPKFAYDPSQYRIHSIRGISTAGETVARVRQFVERRAEEGDTRVMVVLDSDHSMNNVSKELELYAGFVTPGQYLVVEDTNVNGHPVYADHGPGPFEAVEAFLPRHPEFQRDPGCERFLFTQNPGGWLKRQ